MTDNQPSPSAVDVSGLPVGTTWQVVSAGFYHSCGLTGDGQAYCWGDDRGALGNGAVAGVQPSPSTVDMGGLPSGTNWDVLAQGSFTTCGVTNDGAGYCWGGNNFGQLGIGETGTVPDVPHAIDSLGTPTISPDRLIVLGVVDDPTNPPVVLTLDDPDHQPSELAVEHP